MVGQSFLTGNSQEANTVMVIVPEFKNVDKVCVAKGLTEEEIAKKSFVEKVNEFAEDIKVELHKQLSAAILASKEVKAFEKPHVV